MVSAMRRSLSGAKRNTFPARAVTMPKDDGVQQYKLVSSHLQDRFLQSCA